MGKTCRPQSLNGVNYGDPWRQVQASKKKKGLAGTAGGLGSQSGVDDVGPQGLSIGSRWSTSCNLNTVLHYVGPMPVINTMPVVANE